MAVFGFFLLLALLGIPVFASLGISGLIYLVANSTISPEIMGSATFTGLDSFVMLAIPLFILSGDLMMNGGVSERLVSIAKRCFKNPLSGVGNIAIVSSAFFGAVCGSSAATVSAIGGIMLPEMEKARYQRHYAASLVAAAGFLGILIPPSGPLVIYSISANQSVGKLFIAVISTGVLYTLGFVLLNNYIHKKYLLPDAYEVAEREKNQNKKGLFSAIIGSIPALLMPIIILGGIYSGIFTPTESAAVSVVYGLIVGLFIYRSISFKDLPRIFKGSAVSSANILLIVGFANFFGRVLTIFQVPQKVTSFIVGITDNKYLILLIINVFLLILGMLMETSTAIILTTPILLPLVTAVGVSPIHFGVMMIANLSVGLITPPMALNLFVGAQVANVPVAKMVRPIMYYVGVSILLLIVVVYFPQLSMWLPNLLY